MASRPTSAQLFRVQVTNGTPFYVRQEVDDLFTNDGWRPSGVQDSLTPLWNSGASQTMQWYVPGSWSSQKQPEKARQMRLFSLIPFGMAGLMLVMYFV